MDDEDRALRFALVAAPIYAYRLRLPGSDDKAMDDAIRDAARLICECRERYSKARAEVDADTLNKSAMLPVA